MRNCAFCLLLPILALALAGCKFTAEFKTPAGFDAKMSGELNPFSGKPAEGGKSMGRGKITLEDGTELKGEFFDTDGDGKPDKFKPDEGQGGNSGDFGTTNGNDWYDLTLDDCIGSTSGPTFI